MKTPFSENELELTGYNHPLKDGETGAPVFKRPITPRENFKLLVDGKTPWWMPFVSDHSYDFQVIRPRMFPDNVAKRIVYDAEPPIEYDSLIQKGWFDVVWQYEPSAGGAMTPPGTAPLDSMIDWEDHITIPNVDELDWARSAEANKEYLNTDTVRAIAFVTCFWERLITLMDISDAAVALIDEDEQEGIHRFFDKLTDQYVKMVQYAKKYYDVDMVFWSDSWGTQTSTFFSPALHREMIVPYLKRIIDACHANDMAFEIRSCGKNEALVPNMIEAGVDLWSGQEINDFEMLAHQYKDKPIIFGIPAPAIPEDATQEEIDAIVADLLERYDGCRVALNCRFGYPTPEFGNSLYRQSREKYLDK